MTGQLLLLKVLHLLVFLLLLLNGLKEVASLQVRCLSGSIDGGLQSCFSSSGTATIFFLSSTLFIESFGGKLSLLTGISSDLIELSLELCMSGLHESRELLLDSRVVALKSV